MKIVITTCLVLPASPLAAALVAAFPVMLLLMIWLRNLIRSM